MLFWLVFLYGFVAGFLLIRLSRKRETGDREWRWLVAAARLVLALSLTLAAASLAWLAWQAIAPAG